MPVRPEYKEYYGKRVRLSAEGYRLVAGSKQYALHAPLPQEWVGTITQLTKVAGYWVLWDHYKKHQQWHRKYVEIINDRSEAFVPRVQLGCEKASPTPSQRVRAQ